MRLLRHGMAWHGEAIALGRQEWRGEANFGQLPRYAEQ
jgi:hypothetical protein